MKAAEVRDDGMCFACGERNREGLHLRFECDGREASAPVEFRETFQGYRGVVHGGLVSTVLDEAMVTFLNSTGELAVTAELSVRFLEPARIREALRVTAWLVEKRGRLRRMAARLARTDGTEVARATGTCVHLGPMPPRDPGADRR